MSREAQMAEAKARMKSKQRNTKNSSSEQIPTPVPAAKDSIAYYDWSRGAYWTRNSDSDWIQVTESSLKRRLRWEVYGDVQEREVQMLRIDKHLLRLQQENDVAYAGPIAGYHRGLHAICGLRVLVTEGPRLLKWKEGPCNTVRNFVETLLGSNAGVFYGWLKCGLRTLYAGSPFRPGQMLAIAGPADCGKSLLQNLLTEVFGGRSAKPYRYLTGDTSFNADLLRAEHLMVEDDASSTDIRSRRAFGTMLKNMIVNETQSLHRKGRDAITITPFTRITITLNDEPENLMVLPPMEESLQDKIILLRAVRANFPFEADDLTGRNAFRQRLTDELPCFINFVRNYRIPESRADRRYGIKAFHDPTLLKDLMELAPEWKLLGLIDSLYPWELGSSEWEGTAAELETKLREKDRTGMIRDLLYFSSACGVYLKGISAAAPERISSRRGHGGVRLWTVKKPV